MTDVAKYGNYNQPMLMCAYVCLWMHVVYWMHADMNVKATTSFDGQDQVALTWILRASSTVTQSVVLISQISSFLSFCRLNPLDFCIIGLRFSSRCTHIFNF